MLYALICAVGFLSRWADNIGAYRVAAMLHALWRRMGLAWSPSTFRPALGLDTPPHTFYVLVGQGR